MQICMSACLHVCLSSCLCLFIFFLFTVNASVWFVLSFCLYYCPACLLVFFVVYLPHVCLSNFVLSKCRLSACLCVCLSINVIVYMLYVYLSMYVVSTCCMSICLCMWCLHVACLLVSLSISVLGWVDWMAQKSFSWSYSKHISVYVNIL